MTLTGRRVLVGGDARVAIPIADAASRRGATVILATHRRAAAPVSQPTRVVAIDGGEVLEGEVERAVEAALETAHGLDSLVVAIESGPLPPLHESSLAAWEQCVTGPLRAVLWLIRRSVHELLTASRGGQIVFLVARGNGASGVDAASLLEDALLSLARSIAKEYGRRAITCNVVTSGPGLDAQRAAVAAALFLASPAAGFVTGEYVYVGAGSSEHNTT